MDEKTVRSTRAKVYIAFAVIAAVLMPLIGDSTIRLVALAVVVVYCLGMAWYNFRKARDEDKK